MFAGDSWWKPAGGTADAPVHADRDFLNMRIPSDRIPASTSTIFPFLLFLYWPSGTAAARARRDSDRRQCRARIWADGHGVRTQAGRMQSKVEGRVTSDESRVTSDEWRVASDEWRVASDESRVPRGQSNGPSRASNPRVPGAQRGEGGAYDSGSPVRRAVPRRSMRYDLPCFTNGSAARSVSCV